MNIYCKIESQEDYDYFFQYDPDEYTKYPCLFNIDLRHLSGKDKEVGILLHKTHTLESDAEWVTVEKMKELAFIRSLEL